MKKLILFSALICASLPAIAQTQQCKATTKKGSPCSRQATKQGFCTQHFKMMNSAPRDKDINLPEEINQANVGDTFVVTSSKNGFVTLTSTRPVTRKKAK